MLEIGVTYGLAIDFPSGQARQLIGNRCIISALTTSGMAVDTTWISGYRDDAMPSMISTASAAFRKAASNLTLCRQAR